MKVTYEELTKIIKETQHNQVLLRETLKYVFSFPENIDVFSYYIFPDAITSKIPRFHYDIYDFLEDKGDGALAAPRGHAKSTVCGLFYLVWSIVNKKEKYIIYVSSNHSKTVQFLDPIRDAFKHNKRLIDLYETGLESVKDDDGRDREDCFDTAGVRVEAVSFEKNLRGFKYKFSRPTLIICDDIESDDRVLNPELRMKDQYKLDKIIIPSLDPESGRLKLIGTILHWDSLLVKKIRLYDGKIYKACNVDFTDILWPEYFTDKILRDKHRSIGSVSFSSEYLNNPVENEASLIKKEWVDKCKSELHSYDDYKEGIHYLGVDFAFGDRAIHDSTVFAGVAPLRDKYLINRLDWYKGLSITEQFNMLQGLHIDHRYYEVVLEENSIRGMSKELMNYKFPYRLIWMGASDPASKMKPDFDYKDKRQTIGKKSVILRLATLFENQKFILPYKTEEDKSKTNRLTEELMTFALNDGKLVEVGIHADAPIAICMAMERATSKGGYGFSI